jgi:penicillin amidase
MLAADPQHSLTSPSALWFVHLEVMPAAGSNEPAVRVAGAAWPGVPGVVTGFNDGLAWAMASSMSDEADLYAEVPGDDGGSVRFEGAQVGLQHVQEPIAIQGAAPMELDVALVPHHGPVLPVIEEHAVTQPEAGAAMVSVRWSGFRARGELEALLGLMRATDVAQGRAALASWGSGARHFVLADAKGSVAAVAQPVPARSRQAYLWDSDRMRGRLPCMLLPGSGAAEWTGMLDAGSMPSMHNPSRGWVAAAAADAVGLTLDNDPSNDTLPDGSPVYLSCSYDPGFRQTRIAERLRAAGPLELEKLAALQADVRSPLGERLTRHLRGSIARALEEKAYPGTHPGLSSVVGSARFASADLAGVAAVLDDWASLGFEARMGVRLSDGVPSEQGEDARASKGALLFNAWLTRVMQLSLGDEAGRLGFEQGLPGELGIRALLHLFEGKPGELASWDAEVGDSILWDDLLTEPLEGRDDRVVTALLDAVEWLAGVLGNNRDDWRWGVLHTVRMGPLVPGVGGEAVPPEGDKIFAAGFPRPGDLFALDGCSYDWRKSSLAEVSFSYKAGASMRFAVELTAQGPRARVAHSGEVMAGVGGAVYGEEVGYWRSNLQHEVPFGIDAVLSSSRSRAAVSVK